MKKFFVAALAALISLASGAQRIAVLSDIHVTPGNACEDQLRKAVAEINADKSIQIVVLDGDLTNEGSDEQLSNVKSITDQIDKPFYVVPGNHENNWSQSATKTFIDLWGADRFVGQVDSLFIIGLNCGPFMKMGDGHIKQEDLHWLESTLAQRWHPGLRVLSFNHYPINEDLDNAYEYLSILSKYPTIAHINGHYHKSDHYNAGTLDCVMVRSLDMKNGDYGYTVLDIDPDWVHVYNKTLGEQAEPRIAFPALTKHEMPSQPRKKRWRQPDGFEITTVWTDSASIFTRLGFDADRIYFGNSLGYAKAIGKSTGEEVWRVPTGASLFSRPIALNGGKVAVPGAEGITVVDRRGRVVKVYPSKEGPYVADGVVDGKAWYQGGYKRFERRDASTGKLVWSYDSIFNYCQAAPVVSGPDVVFGAWDTNLRCLDAKTGRLRWAWNNGKKANMLGPGNVVPVVTSDKVIVVAPDRYMTALDRATGRQLWRDNSVKYRESLGASEDLTRVYAKTMDGELVAVDATSPEFHMLWKVDMGLGYEHAPCIVAEHDGVVYAGSRRGVITAVDPTTQTVLWSVPVGTSEVNGIDIDPSTGNVYASLVEGTIVKIEKKK